MNVIGNVGEDDDEAHETQVKILIPLILLGFPLLEVWGLVETARVLGWWLAAWLVLTFITGLALMREAGTALLFELIGNLMTPAGAVRAPLRSHRNFLAGFLLAFPGVISDLIALTLLVTARTELPRFDTYPRMQRARVIEGQFRRER